MIKCHARQSWVIPLIEHATNVICRVERLIVTALPKRLKIRIEKQLYNA